MNNLLELIENYISHLDAKGYSHNTLVNYEVSLRYFYSYCKAFVVDFRNIKGSQMISYVNVMAKYSHSTVNLRLTVLRGFYEYLIDMDIVKYNVVRQSLYIRKNRKKPKPLTDNEVDLFISYLDTTTEHIKLAFIVLLETGLRLSELLKLDIYSLDEINDSYYIRVSESKNEGERIVPISFETYMKLVSYDAESIYSGPFFTLSRRAYQYHAERFSALNNIKFTVHSLRHTFATNLSKEKVPLQIIQKLLGHKDISTTMYYVNVTDDDILDYVAGLEDQ